MGLELQISSSEIREIPEIKIEVQTELKSELHLLRTLAPLCSLIQSDDESSEDRKILQGLDSKPIAHDQEFSELRDCLAALGNDIFQLLIRHNNSPGVL